VGLFVQLAEAPGPVDPARAYRGGFHQYVHAHGDSAKDLVILVEPSASRVGSLQSMWQDWPRTEFRRYGSTPEGADADDVTYYSADGADSADPVFTRDPDFALTFHPNGRLKGEILPCPSLHALLEDWTALDRISLLSIDLGALPSSVVESIDWAGLPCDAVALTTASVPLATTAVLVRQLRAAGFRPAGRGWGDAGTGLMLRRANSVSARITAGTAQARITIGAGIVGVRDAMPSPDQRRAMSHRVRELIDPRLSANDVLDYSFGRPLSQMDSQQVYAIVEAIRHSEARAWDLPELVEPDIDALAAACRAQHGVWPISFSYPKQMRPPVHERSEVISHIVPGYPYSFTDEDEYLDTYGRAALAVTHRKAGWDCFRHLEILAAGTVPLMLDVDKIPKHSMVHYPKAALQQVRTAVLDDGLLPGQQTRQLLHDYAERRLTSEAMARYVLRSAGLPAAERVLFIDERLPQAADYLSLMTLIGLKQLLGRQCRVGFPVAYIYGDSEQPATSLYGRGFGYSRSVPVTARHSSEEPTHDPIDLAAISPQDIDAIVVGSVSRNYELARSLLASFPASRTIWVHGEDGPPTPAEVRAYREAGTHVFVRAIEPPGSIRLRR
jgi:hypothetical protein